MYYVRLITSYIADKPSMKPLSDTLLPRRVHTEPNPHYTSQLADRLTNVQPPCQHRIHPQFRSNKEIAVEACGRHYGNA